MFICKNNLTQGAGESGGGFISSQRWNLSVCQFDTVIWITVAPTGPRRDWGPLHQAPHLTSLRNSFLPTMARHAHIGTICSLSPRSLRLALCIAALPWPWGRKQQLVDGGRTQRPGLLLQPEQWEKEQWLGESLGPPVGQPCYKGAPWMCLRNQRMPPGETSVRDMHGQGKGRQPAVAQFSPGQHLLPGLLERHFGPGDWFRNRAQISPNLNPMPEPPGKSSSSTSYLLRHLPLRKRLEERDIPTDPAIETQFFLRWDLHCIRDKQATEWLFSRTSLPIGHHNAFNKMKMHFSF